MNYLTDQKVTRTLLCKVIAGLLLVLLASLSLTNPVSASIYDPKITVESPIEGEIYKSGNVQMKFTVVIYPGSYPLLLSTSKVAYYIDEMYRGELGERGSSSDFTLKVPNGEHSLRISAGATYVATGGTRNFFNSVTIRFTVDTGVGPSVSVVGLSDYKASQATLNITVDVPDAQLKYSLDGQSNVTIPQLQLIQYHGRYQYTVNFTDLPDGSYTLIAYASDALYTSVAEKTFTVETGEAQPTQEPNGVFPTTLIAVAVTVIVAAVASAWLLLYFKKHKH